MLPLMRRALAGAMVSVGGERSFRAASMLKGIRCLIIVDASEDVNIFAKINRELLRAPSREAYTALRWYACYDRWKELSAKLTLDDFVWWEKNIRSNRELPELLNRCNRSYFSEFGRITKKLLHLFPVLKEVYDNNRTIFLQHVTWNNIVYALQQLRIENTNVSEFISSSEFEWFYVERENVHSPASKYLKDPQNACDWSQVLDYKSGNYVLEEAAYEGLHNLAIQDSIVVLRADLNTTQGLLSLVDTVASCKTSLSVLDLNNLYLLCYMGEARYRKVVHALQGFAKKQSILVVMANYADFAEGQFQVYIGFTFENLNEWTKQAFLANFFDSLPRTIAPELNGKLFEKQEELPDFY
jgi:hypothetical protein